MKVTCLVENTSSSECLVAEHGLSLFIEGAGKRYLLDTGASDAFLRNSWQLGVDLSRLNAIAISHNHYDHIGGLAALLKLNPQVKVYIKAAAKNDFFAIEGERKRKLSLHNWLFEAYADRFVWIDSQVQLDEHTFLLSSVDNDPHFGCTDSRLHMLKNGELAKDTFEHELFVLYVQGNGVSIFSSCSHSGIVNIIRTTQERFPSHRITHIFAGLHLKGSLGADSLCCSPDFVSEVAQALKHTSAQVYTCHCTGNKAYELLKEELADRLYYLAAGSVVLAD